jgi:hypothetical protein
MSYKRLLLLVSLLLIPAVAQAQPTGYDFSVYFDFEPLAPVSGKQKCQLQVCGDDSCSTIVSSLDISNVFTGSQGQTYVHECLATPVWDGVEAALSQPVTLRVVAGDTVVTLPFDFPGIVRAKPQTIYHYSVRPVPDGLAVIRQ